MRVVCLTLVVCAAAFGQDPSVAVSPPPAGYKPKTDVALSPTATEAVRVSEGFRTESNPPSPGPDGRVVYTFGAGLATLVCAPLPATPLRRRRLSGRCTRKLHKAARP